VFGQYFGRNKVQYEKFDYRVLKTEHFDVYFYPEEEQATKVGAQMAERWYKRYARLFNYELRGRQALIMSRPRSCPISSAKGRAASRNP
jgi:hypothetical protein